MQPALALQTAEPRVFRFHPVGKTRRAVRIADADIALLPKRMIGQSVIAQIFADLAVAPIDDGVKFEDTVLAFEHRKILARRGVFAAQAGDPQLGTEIGQRAVHRLHLVEASVFLESLDALLPEFSVDRFLPRRGHARTVNFQIQAKLFGHFVGEAIGLGEQISRVDEDDRNLRVEARDQVQHDRSLRAETRAEHGMAAEFLQGPTDALGGGPRYQIAVPFGEPGVVVTVLQGGGHKREPCRISGGRLRGKKQITLNSMDPRRPAAR